jgi:hypothetical protein
MAVGFDLLFSTMAVGSSCLGCIAELWQTITENLQHMLFPLSGPNGTWTTAQAEVEHRLDADVVR